MTWYIHWTPELIFGVSFLLSTFAGLCSLAKSQKPLNFTHTWSYSCFYGLAGSGLALITYEIGGQDRPGVCIIAGMMVGLGVIPLSWIGEMVKGILGVLGNIGKHGDKNDHRSKD